MIALPAPGQRQQQGVSLIELMIAMTIGLLVMAALTSIYIKNSNLRSETDRVSRQLESGRYAMQLLTLDLQQAGYFAEFDPRVLSTPATPPDPCDNSLTTLSSAMALQVQGYDSPVANPLTCLSDVKTGTDIVVVRRASDCVAGTTNCDAAVAGDYLFQASLCNSSSELGGSPAVYFKLDTDAANLTLTRRDCATLSYIQRYFTHIYFIANDNKTGDGVPTLKMASLGAGGWSIVPLVDGIDNLQFEYGVDTNGDGAPDAYTASPDLYNSCSSSTTPSCATYWRDVVSIKVYLLSRNVSQTTGHVDTKTYSLGLNADGTTNTLGPFSDAYERHAYETVVRLNNPSARSATE